MTIEVHKLPDEPIIVYTYIDLITPEDIVEARHEAAVLAEGLVGTVFRISDTLRAKLDFATGVRVLAAMRSNEPGSAWDSRFQEIAIIHDDLVQLLVQSLGQEQYGSLNIPIFQDMDQALLHARQHLRDLA